MTDPQVQRLRRLDVCAVSDALDKLQLTGVVTGLPQRSSAPGGASRIAGRARAALGWLNGPSSANK